MTMRATVTKENPGAMRLATGVERHSQLVGSHDLSNPDGTLQAVR